MAQLDAQASDSLTAFLKGWGSLIVAAVALVQPWVIGLWKKFFRPGTIDIHETGTIEVGYSGFGPTIGLRGTLRAVHRDQFVRDIQLAVAKLKDDSKHSGLGYVCSFTLLAASQRHYSALSDRCSVPQFDEALWEA